MGLIRNWKRMAKKRRRNSQLHKSAAVYLAKKLPPHLKVSNIECIVDHYTRKIWKADSTAGPICIKMYSGHQVEMARRQVDLHKYLDECGVNYAEVVHLDAPSGLHRTEWGSLIMKWLPGAKLDPKDHNQMTKAFHNLGKIHSVAPPKSLTPLAPGEKLTDMKWQLSRNLHQFRRAGIPGIEEVEEQYINQLTPFIESIHSDNPPVGLIHFDYSHDNLILGNDGELYAIDLDDLQPGVIVFDLAISLLHFFYGLRSEQLTETSIDGVIGDPRFDDAVNAWAEHVPPRALEVWNQHRDRLMLWAYIKAAGNLATRTRDNVRFTSEQRVELRKRADLRLAELKRFLNAHGGKLTM